MGESSTSGSKRELSRSDRVKKLEQKRKEVGLSQEELSKLAGFSHSFWWTAVGGSTPTHESLDRVESTLHRSLHTDNGHREVPDG